MADHPRLPKHNPNATVLSIDDFMSLDSTVTDIIVDNGMNEPDLTGLDLTRFCRLKSLLVGDYCFSSVNEVKLIGMNELESVVVRENSFTQKREGDNPNRHFYLKDCPKLRSLKMGRYSFSDYKVIEIENVDALESLRIGDDSRYSSNFYGASLELRSVFDVMK